MCVYIYIYSLLFFVCLYTKCIFSSSRYPCVTKFRPSGLQVLLLHLQGRVARMGWAWERNKTRAPTQTVAITFETLGPVRPMVRCGWHELRLRHRLTHPAHATRHLTHTAHVTIRFDRISLKAEIAPSRLGPPSYEHGEQVNKLAGRAYSCLQA